MNKKNIALIAITLVLAGVYIIYFTDWLKPKTIQITSTSRPLRATGTGPATDRLIFGLDDSYSLTEVKVVALAELQTNKFAQPAWHLVSEDGSDDVKQFFYGEQIRGMDPAAEGGRPEPLQPGATYRLFVAAGKARGQYDFHVGTVTGQ